MSQRDFVFVLDTVTGVVSRYVTDPYLDSKRYKRVEDPREKHREIVGMNDDLIEGVGNGADDRRAAK